MAEPEKMGQLPDKMIFVFFVFINSLCTSEKRPEVAVNRDGIGDEEVDAYCASEDIDVAFRLPDDRRIAEAYSSGKLITDALKEYREHFPKLYDDLENIRTKLDEERRLRIQRKNLP